MFYHPFSNRILQNRIYLAAILCLWFFASNCNSQQAIDDISKRPKVTEADRKFADVFQSLDGKWQGEFFVYEDTLGQQKYDEKVRQTFLTSFEPGNPGFSLKSQLKITVEQSYTSESPYFQRVEIIDLYTKDNGKVEIIKSVGVNKIQNGKLWCVVQKPDETVIHSGSLDGEDTIIWQRTIKDPQRIEYFRETVSSDEYTILGWGYYGEDNPQRNPKTWFYGKYVRVE